MSHDRFNELMCYLHVSDNLHLYSNDQLWNSQTQSVNVSSNLRNQPGWTAINEVICILLYLGIYCATCRCLTTCIMLYLGLYCATCTTSTATISKPKYAHYLHYLTSAALCSIALSSICQLTEQWSLKFYLIVSCLSHIDFAITLTSSFTGLHIVCCTSC